MPRPFTFEETGTGGGAGSSTTAGGEGGSSTTSSASGATTSSSSTGTGMSACKEGTVCNDAFPNDGWEGPAIVLVSSADGPKPSCPEDAKPLDILHIGPLGKFECTPCENCVRAGATCSAPQITCWYGDDCMTGFVSTWKADKMDCVNGPNPPPAEDQPGSCMLTEAANAVSQGTCSHVGGLKVNEQYWETDVRVCAPTLTGVGEACGMGGTCESISTGQQLCIRKAGMNECPPGWDVDRFESFANAIDDRGCSQCLCNDISCSGGGYTFYDTLGCTGNFIPMDANAMGACFGVPNMLGSVSYSLKPSLGQVNQNGCGGGGQPTGTFTPTDPVTFCCAN